MQSEILVESACSRVGPTERLKIEEAGGSSSGQKEYNLVVPFHGGFWS